MILVTGHKGFIGSRLIEKLPKHLVIGIDLKDGDHLFDCHLPKNIDTIYHFAAQTSVEASWHDPVLDHENIGMTLRLIEEYPNAKIIYAASAASLELSSPYGLSKKVCEDYLKLLHKNFVICRFPNVYGGGTKSVVDIFKGKERVTVYGDGLQVRDFVHVDDIIEGLLLAKDWPKGEYSMGSGKGTKILDLAQNVFVTFAPARKESRESILPNTTPNWKPKIDVIQYLYAA